MLIINMECFRKLLFEQIPGYTFLWGLMEDESILLQDVKLFCGSCL